MKVSLAGIWFLLANGQINTSPTQRVGFWEWGIGFAEGDRHKLVPAIALIEFNVVFLAEGSEFILEGHGLMMFLLPVDVSDEFVEMR